jgi:hypothetical protein
MPPGEREQFNRTYMLLPPGYMYAVTHRRTDDCAACVYHVNRPTCRQWGGFSVLRGNKKGEGASVPGFCGVACVHICRAKGKGKANISYCREIKGGKGGRVTMSLFFNFNSPLHPNCAGKREASKEGGKRRKQVRMFPCHVRQSRQADRKAEAEASGLANKAREWCCFLCHSPRTISNSQTGGYRHSSKRDSPSLWRHFQLSPPQSTTPLLLPPPLPTIKVFFLLAAERGETQAATCGRCAAAVISVNFSAAESLAGRFPT